MALNSQEYTGLASLFRMISRAANTIFIAHSVPAVLTLQKTKNCSSKLGSFSYFLIEL